MAIDYRPLAYTAPSGDRLEFLYDGTIEDGKTHNLGEFTFSGSDEKYFQDRSLTSNAYPFNILVRDQSVLRTIRKALNEKIKDGKTGILEHPDPTIGTFPVVVSDYTVSQNSVKGKGIIRIAITFYKTITNLLGGDITESLNPSTAKGALVAIDELNINQANDFADSVNTDYGDGAAALSNSITKSIDNINTYLNDLISLSDDLYNIYINELSEITNTIDDLVNSPGDLAQRMQNLIQMAMVATDDATTRISAYSNLLTDTLNFSEEDEKEFTNGTAAGKNILSTSGLVSLAVISAINYSAVSTKSVTIDDILSGNEAPDAGYLSRNQVLETLNSVQNLAFTTTETLSEKAANFGAVTFFDQYFDYSILNKNLIAQTIKNLNKRIFDTTKEVKITTDIELTPIQHCANLYNSVELSTIEFFIDSNMLHGDEIFLVPKGREILYYV